MHSYDLPALCRAAYQSQLATEQAFRQLAVQPLRLQNVPIVPPSTVQNPTPLRQSMARAVRRACAGLS